MPTQRLTGGTYTTSVLELSEAAVPLDEVVPRFWRPARRFVWTFMVFS